MVRLHVFFKCKPGLADEYFAAPCTHTNEFLQVTQTPQDHQSCRKDSGRQEENTNCFEPIFLRTRWRFRRAEVHKRDIDKFVEPNDGEDSEESDYFDEQDHFLGGVMFHFRNSTFENEQVYAEELRQQRDADL